MEEPIGAQYAIQIAVQTLKDRCKSLQQRVTFLEEENLILRQQQGQEEEPVDSLSELRAQIVELSEQKEHLLNKIKMVTTENQELWSKLSRLTQANQTLGSQLNKINDSLVQYTAKNKDAHCPLIRSKTFTQDEPQTKVLQRNIEENNKICMELEEISLKFINSIAQGKSELDSLCAGIAGVNCSVITDSCGFYYEDLDDNVLEDLNEIVKELKVTKKIVLGQQTALKLALNKILTLQKANCNKKVLRKKETVEKSTCTEQQQPENLPVTISPLPLSTSDEQIDMICPMCSKNFFKAATFKDFQAHVEDHFTSESYELL